MVESGNDDDLLISQDDIDNLLNASVFDGAKSLGDDQGDGSEDELGALSQDDIDSLLNTPSADFDSPGDEELPDPDEDDLELVSQEDIDRLMKAAPADGAGDGSRPDGRPISTGNSEDADPGTVQEKALEGESVIDESQALSIEENLITQETIDRLVAGKMEIDPGSEPEESGSGPEQLPGSGLASEPEPDLGMAPFLELETEPDQAPAPLSGDDTIDQADIDDLLRDDLPEGDSDENDLISQDDIDELLRSSEEEDEDVIGALDISPDDEVDIALEGALPVEEDHQVVLEEAKVPAEQTVEPPPDKSLTEPKWYRSKKCMAACLLAVLVVAALPVAYFTFFREKEPVQGPGQVAGSPETAASEVITVQVDLPQMDQAPPGPGNMVLENFVVLVPSDEAGFVYITAGVSIDYSDARAAAEINSHLPLYRDIILEAMGRVFGSGKIDKITESELLAGIKEALNRSLPGRYVEQVQFKAFSTG